MEKQTMTDYYGSSSYKENFLMKVRREGRDEAFTLSRNLGVLV